jgi:hypothetical protein
LHALRHNSTGMARVLGSLTKGLGHGPDGTARPSLIGYQREVLMMAELFTAGKTAATMGRPTAKFLKGALAERERFDCLKGFLTLAVADAVAESGPNVRYALPRAAVDEVVRLALARAVAESNKGFLKRLVGKLRRRTRDLGVYRTDVMQQVIAGWIRAGLPTDFDNWRDFADRAAAGFRHALWAAHEPEAKVECLEFAKELETKFQATDALYKVYDEQQRTRKAAVVVTAAGGVGTAGLGIFEAVEQNIHLLPAPLAVAGATVIASSAIWYRAHKEAPWDQAAARAITLDSARDWLRDVREGNLKAAEAREVLRDRVMPRLADWDVPVLAALLERIADLVEDQAAGRSSFSDHRPKWHAAAVRQLEGLFRQAAALLAQSPDQVDWAHKRQTGEE